MIGNGIIIVDSHDLHVFNIPSITQIMYPVAITNTTIVKFTAFHIFYTTSNIAAFSVPPSPVCTVLTFSRTNIFSQAFVSFQGFPLSGDIKGLKYGTLVEDVIFLQPHLAIT